MISRRLTENDKAQLIEHADLTMIPITNNFIDPKDSSEFHEGMAAGLLLATEIIKNSGVFNAVSAMGITTCVVRCIQESET
jgi:hypothetical protein